MKDRGVEMNNPLLAKEALYYDYASAANPIYQKIISPVPYRSFSPNSSIRAPHACNRST